MEHFKLKEGSVLWIMKQNLILGLTLKLQLMCGMR